MLTKRVRIYRTKGGSRRVAGYAVVDMASAWLVEGFRWRFDRSGYPVTSIGRRNVGMHRLIVLPLPGTVVDHINGDKLDNRRSNLRPATHQQNMWNSKTRRDSVSGLRGAYYEPSRGKYRSHIRVAGKLRFLGYFDTAKEASSAYNAVARVVHGKFFRDSK